MNVCPDEVKGGEIKGGRKYGTTTKSGVEYEIVHETRCPHGAARAALHNRLSTADAILTAGRCTPRVLRLPRGLSGRLDNSYLPR